MEFKNGKNEKRKIIVSVRNRSPIDVTVDAIYINGKHYEIKEGKEISSDSVEHIEIDFSWKEKEHYNVKVCTHEGLKVEGNFSSPN